MDIWSIVARFQDDEKIILERVRQKHIMLYGCTDEMEKYEITRREVVQRFEYFKCHQPPQGYEWNRLIIDHYIYTNDILLKEDKRLDNIIANFCRRN